MVRNIRTILTKYNIHCVDDLISLIKTGNMTLDVNDVYAMAEYLNPDKESKAAYYTDPSICSAIFNRLPSTNQKTIRVLEPSVGVGVFLGHIINHFKYAEKIELYIVDIDNEMLNLCVLIFETFFAREFPNVTLVPINDDYLTHAFGRQFFDFVIGNPPFKRVKGTDGTLETYRSNSCFRKTKNLYAFFIEKAIRESKFVSLITPKMFLNAPEHDEIRNYVSHFKIHDIIDFGEQGFKGVLIETINLMIDVNGTPDITSVFSFQQNMQIIQEQHYIIDSRFPTWILYRDLNFDSFFERLHVGIFKCFRDRQIVSKNCLPQGKYRVLRSRNIKTNGVVNIPGYDLYLNSISEYEVSKFLNVKNVICIPNLTYFPRACFLPEDCIADGSVALLTSSMPINKKQLEIFETDEFRLYYKIVTNYATRSLNIDRNSIYYFGVMDEQK